MPSQVGTQAGQPPVPAQPNLPGAHSHSFIHWLLGKHQPPSTRRLQGQVQWRLSSWACSPGRDTLQGRLLENKACVVWIRDPQPQPMETGTGPGT